MKEHIVKLLLEEYKQNCLFSELADKGIDMQFAAIGIYDIIFDLLGFPKDGTPIPEETLGEHPAYNKASILNGRFNRDYLSDKYGESFNGQRSDYTVTAYEGLRFETKEGFEDAEKKTRKFVDWLYDELKRVPI